MSGGSYNYVFALDPMGDADKVVQELRQMETDMRGEGFCLSADAIRGYREQLERYSNQLQAEHTKLAPLMKAWEWYRSGDDSKEDFVKMSTVFSQWSNK